MSWVVGTYDWGLVWEYKGDLFHGLLTAIEVAAVALVISVVVGLALALARMGKAPVSWIAAAYVNVFRGVPTLVSVIWVYYGWSLVFGINFTVFQAGVIALTLLYGAFICEIYRAALQAIPRGQREAGLALGMHPLRIFVQVTRVVQNVGSTTYQYFVLYTAAAGTYVLAAFFFDFLFRMAEKTITTPPSGRFAHVVAGRRKRRIDLLVKEIEGLSGRT